MRNLVLHVLFLVVGLSQLNTGRVFAFQPLKSSNGFSQRFFKTSTNTGSMILQLQTTNCQESTHTKNAVSNVVDVYSPKSGTSSNKNKNNKNNTYQILSPAIQEFLDLNGDGNVDIQDVVYLVTKIKNQLDVNGDGKVDLKDVLYVLEEIESSFLGDYIGKTSSSSSSSSSTDHRHSKQNLQNAMNIICTVLLLTLSPLPASAKGGGHGGGGHSSHSRSSYRSRSSSGSGGHGNSLEEDYPMYKRPNSQLPNNKKVFNLMQCSDLPDLEEEILVKQLSRIIGQKPKYEKNVVTSINKDRCTFQVKSSSSRSESTLRSIRNWEEYDGVFFGYSILCALLYSELFPVETDEVFHKRMEEAEEKAKDSTLMTPSFIPKSGLYTGFSDESDGMTQSIETTLNFKMESNTTGTVSGFGFDQDDGKYTLQGKIAGSKVKWSEEYQEGFTTVVRGTIRKNGEIYCTFRSTRCVRGTFVLRKK